MHKVAVVGAGQIAQRVYLPALARMQDVELAAVVEPDAQRRALVERKYRVGRAVATVGELRPGEADRAFLLTGESVRREPLEGLLAAGLDVLCEKPLSLDPAEAEELAALAERRGRILMVGFNRRFMPVYRQAKEWIAGRRLELVRVQKERANLRAHSLHVLDVLCWLCGRPVEVQAMGELDGERETVAAALIRFDSGAVGLFQSSLHFGTRKETLEAHGEGFTVFVEAPDRAYLYEGPGKRLEFRPGADVWYQPAEERYGFVQQIRHFLEAAATRATPESSAAEALRAHRLADDILKLIRRIPDKE